MFFKTFEKKSWKKCLKKKFAKKKFEKSMKKGIEKWVFFSKSITDTCSSWKKKMKEVEKCFNKKPTASLLAHLSTIRNSVISWIS